MLTSASLLLCFEQVEDLMTSRVNDKDDSFSENPLVEETQLIEVGGVHPFVPISELLASENDHRPLPDYIHRLRDHSVDPLARRNAIAWILKVHRFYEFRPVTAYLAVNYLDRFLSSNTLPESGWPWQLLSVACLSVAAKMEETQVPQLLDLQAMDPPFMFNPPTIIRMELFLMDALMWRMRSITPFDFFDHFAAGDDHRNNRIVFSTELLARASDLVLITHRVVEFMEYTPSAIAAAAILCAAEETAGFSDRVDVELKFLYDLVNKDTVLHCRRLMDTCRTEIDLMRIEEGTHNDPQSPVGVLDAVTYGSCDSEKSSVSVQTPPSKRCKIGSSFRCKEDTVDTVDTVDVVVPPPAGSGG